MAEKDILGHIDCPTCGTKVGMRITLDKNREPFGYCEANCSQQLRIGGDRRRVRDFYAAHPGIKNPEQVQEKPGYLTVEDKATGKIVPVTDTGKPAAPKPVTVTDTGPKPEPVKQAKPGFSLGNL